MELKGESPEAYEKECEYFRQKGWEMIFSSLDRIEETARTILSSSAILSGIYFAALKISPIEKLHALNTGQKIILLSPLFCWFFSFILSFLAISRKGIDFAQDDDAQLIREIVRITARKKFLFLEAASYSLSVSIILLVIILIALFFLI